MASGIGLGLAIVTSAGLAGAATVLQENAERSYSLLYEAAADCPDATVLTRAIESRTPGAVQQTSDSAAVRLRVQLRADGTSTLWVDLPEGGSRREFPAAACADAVASIAVISSMVLEAAAAGRAAATQSMMDRVEPAAPPAEPAAEPTPAAPSAPSAPSAKAGATSPTAPAQRTPSAAPKPKRARVAFPAGALLESAVAHGAALGASVGVAGWLEPPQPSLWQPGIRLEVLGTLPATVHAAQGDAVLRLLAARLHVCPLRFPIGATLRLFPCVTGDLGSLSASGSGASLNQHATKTMPWRALGGTLRAELAWGHLVSLESWLSLRGLTRADRFVFSPDFTAYQVPKWSLGAGLGVSVSLP